MSGLKAVSIERFARKNRLKPSVLNVVVTEIRWKVWRFYHFRLEKDLINIIDNVAKGPQILVGSSMGGWLMFLAAKARPSRVAGMLGLAAAPDYIDNF